MQRLRSVAKQRALQDESDGVSCSTVQPTTKASSFNSFDREAKHYVTATLLIAKTLKEEQASRHALEFKIHHDARMAEQRLIRGNDRAACLSMARVVKAQLEYVRILQRVAAITTLRYSLDNQLVEGKQARKYLNEILSKPVGDSRQTELDETELLDQLERGDFFPILNIETGAITFTSSYEYASTLEIDSSRSDETVIETYTHHPEQ
ncbi:MAG: hypothetical protein SGBAC_013299 [Bacillariaceae sp.]